MTVTSMDWLAIAPGLIVAFTGLIAVGIDLFLKDGQRAVLAPLTFLGVAASTGLVVQRLMTGAAPISAFGNSVVLDQTALFLSAAIGAATLLLLAMSVTDTARRHVQFGEYYALLCMAAAGMMFLVESNDFVMLFLNIELLSLSMYILTGVTRRNPRANEAAVKYLVTGAFSTGFLLLGMAYLFGATGTLNLTDIGAALAAGNRSGLLAPGVGLLLVGLGFKVGAAPFHMWVPDVYEGAPTSTTAYMSVTVKAASFGALIRVLLTALSTRPDLWTGVLWWLAVATMIVGNLLAVWQPSVKRMLAYSSIAHTGYALLGLATMYDVHTGAFSTQGASAVLFYLFAYTFMTLGAFAFLIYVGHEVKAKNWVEWQDGEHVDDLAGLGARRPWAAAAMTLFLISLGGLPPTAGFAGKFWLFKSAVDNGHYSIAVIGVLASLVSWYYYLRVVVSMYMRDPITTDEKPAFSVGAIVAATAAATIAIGVAPSLLLDLAGAAFGR